MLSQEQKKTTKLEPKILITAKFLRQTKRPSPWADINLQSLLVKV